MKQYYLGFEFFCDPHTTMGYPNPRNGKCSKAGALVMFPRYLNGPGYTTIRDEWVNKNSRRIASQEKKPASTVWVSQCHNTAKN